MNEPPPLLTGEALTRARWADMEQALAANPEAMRYDAVDDTLTIHIGPPRPALSITLDDRLFFRVDPTTWELVGVEIENLRGAE